MGTAKILKEAFLDLIFEEVRQRPVVPILPVPMEAPVTPEARVKKSVSLYLTDVAKELDAKGLELYVSMFVPVGYGKRNSLDYTLCFAGHYVAIETKAPGEWLTGLQRQTCRAIYRSGGTVFIISGPEGLAALKRWVERHAHRLFAR